MKKRLVIALSLLILFSTYKSNKLPLIQVFNIKEIKIENNFIIKKTEIKKDLSFLYNTNIFFLKTYEIEKALNKFTFIKGYKIKKIYPNKLKIIIFEKKPIAILQSRKDKFYLDEKIELINYLELKNYSDLPVVFGDKKNFKALYDNLKKTRFPMEQIKKYYLYESNRWDLETHTKKLIKLPKINYNKSLLNFISLNAKSNFDKYKVFDYRISNQLILK